MRKKKASTSGGSGAAMSAGRRPRSAIAVASLAIARLGSLRPPPGPTSASSPAKRASKSPPPPKAEKAATLAGSHPYSVITELNFNRSRATSPTATSGTCTSTCRRA